MYGVTKKWCQVNETKIYFELNASSSNSLKVDKNNCCKSRSCMPHKHLTVRIPSQQWQHSLNKKVV